MTGAWLAGEYDSKGLRLDVNGVEAAARAAIDFPYSVRSTPQGGAYSITDGLDSFSELWLAVDPARVLAECEAKRAIVEEHGDYGGYGTRCQTCARYDDLANDPWPCPTLRALATIWRDHESWREEWAL